mgnify:FL=1
MRTKKLLSLLLVLALFITGAFAAMITSGATLLNIKEVRATLTLSGYTRSQLESMPLRTVLDNIVCDGGAYTLGESIDSNPGAKIVWTRYKDEGGSEIYDEYHVEDLDAVVDLSQRYSWENYFDMEIIVGSGTQLAPGNVRYDVRVTIYNTLDDFTISDVCMYFEQPDGTRTKADTVFNLGGYYNTVISTADDGTEISYPYRYGDLVNYDNTKDGERYIAMDISTSDPEATIKVYSGLTRSAENDITDQILAYWAMPYAGYGFNVSDYFYDYLLFDVYKDGKIIRSEAIYLNGSDYSLYLSPDDIVNVNGKSVTNEYFYNYRDEHRVYSLYSGYSKYSRYTLKFDHISSYIQRVVEGEFTTETEVLAQPNLLESFKNGTYSGVFAEPKTFTLYGVVNGYTYLDYMTVEVEESSFTENLYEKPVFERDPYFYITNVKTHTSGMVNNYIAESSYTRAFDTYYSYGYQTAFVSDDIDMSKIILSVDGDERDNVYDSVGSQKIDFSEPQDFTSGKVQYTISTGSKIRNYFVSVVKAQTGGAKLYVNGPTDRTVNLDDYFKNRHDILIANIGDAELTGLNVEWSVAPQNVKLHDYWTVGGENNDTLAPLTNAASTDYLAKIRLIPDGEGEIRGQLKISADGQEPVYINVSGRAGNPNIVTQSPLKDAVKYVPYSAIIATDNIYSWAHPSFYCSGKLPEGLEFNEKTGEIYGVPTEIGSFKFEVSAQFEDSRGSHLGFPTATKEFELEVLDNTDMNVYNASDDEYTIKTHLGAEQTAGQHDYYLSYESVYSDQVFASNGEFGDFIDLWLNGEKLTEGKDYTKHEGSTVITIKSQTLSDLKRDTSNTIAAEFRVDGKRENELKRTAQNFIIGNVSSKPTEPTDPTEPTNPTTPTNPTNGSTSGNTEKSDSEVKKVIELIEQLPDEITENDADDVDAARRAYDNLTDEQKKQVNNYSKLVDAEKQLDEVKTDEQTPSDENDSTDGEVDSNTDSVKSIGIFGTIYDENGNAISDLSVEIHSEIRKTTTDDRGAFKFDEVEIGKHTLYINGKNGSVSKSFSIEEGDEFIISDDSITFSDEKMVELRIVFDGSSIRFLKNDEEIPTVTQVVVGKDGNPTTAAAFPVVPVIVSGCLAFGALCFKKRK